MEILAYSIPALVVLLTTWLVLYRVFKNEEQKRQWELQKMAQKEMLPIRLRAYERLSLLLERSTPEHLLLDVSLQEMSILEVQQHLLHVLRSEYEHNLSQQIYVSDVVWTKVVHAHGQMGAFVSSVAMGMPHGSSALDYAKTLISAYATNGETPTDIALGALKEEVRRLF